MRPTGATFIATGLYEAACRCRARVHYARGDMAPACPCCGHATLWQIVGGAFPAAPPSPPAPPTPRDPAR
jgi:hypothetical protein